MADPVDSDGDGVADEIKKVSDCSSAAPCSHESLQFKCEAGLYAKYSTVTFDDTATCLTLAECQARTDCGDECLALTLAPTPAPTGSPTEDNTVVIDCSGMAMDPDDYRLTTWLGDDYCDKVWMVNFNCEKFDYDCGDCKKGWQPVSEFCMRDDDEEGGEDDDRRRMMDARLLNQKELKTTACFTCNDGQYCPEGTSSSSSKKCPRDSYCPNPSTKTACEPNYLCPTKYPTSTFKCETGMYCPALASEAETCRPGFYCPEPQYRYICPKGYFCRGADVKPSKCAFYQTCPEGTEVPEGTATSGVIALTLLYILMQLLVKRSNVLKKRAREEKARKEQRTRAQSAFADDWQKLLQASSTRNFNIAHNVNDEEAATENGFQGFVYLKPDKTPIHFEFKDLSLILKSGQRIIDHVSGTVDAGKMTAIMGPSGCGKTTMLNVLRNKASYGKIDGTLKVNDTLDSIAPLQRIVGFVPQEDILHSELTVTEAIKFSSLLRNPFSISTEKRLKMVEEVIDVLGLEKCKNSVIGDQEIRGVSGGQRKRVSIAVELVTNPSICFLDEPTSGLDSTTSIELISMLKKMNHAGMTIVMVIHQPRYEIFEMIDDTLLLGQNGRPVYMGPCLKCLGYFTSIGFPCPPMKSPADHFLDVMSGTVQHDKDPSFTTSMLSDWWEDSGAMSMNDNPLLGAQGSKASPPPIPLATIKKRKESKALQNVSENNPVGITPMNFSVEDDDINGSKSDSNASITLKDRAIDLFQKLASIALIKLVELGKLVKEEAISAVVSFKPSMTDKYRTPPSNPMQFAVCAWRAFRQIFATNKWAGFVSDCLMLVVVGAVLGSLFGVHDEWKEEARKLALRNFTASLGIALTTCLRGLGTFGNERPAFWRERNSGVSCFSYFLGKITTDMIYITVFPGFFLFLFQAIASPRGAFVDYYTVTFMTAWAASGQGYLLSMLFSPESAKFNGLLSCLLCMMFSGVEPALKTIDKGIVGKLLPLSFARWSCEALTVLEFKAYPEVYKDYTDGIMNRTGWEIANLDNCIASLFNLGLGFRVVSFFLLKLSNRNKG
ncbi:hypothetical protein TrST_g8745 [Triparma strigata]|uniref:ABC transporter domain-containing protein n=1 Tax=Triparma strigata TaxID=1606541 RepID=A0A9W7DZX6_9STRA|nr:hypothetical protein TrST_g8745 [Triparma strigata]